MFNFNQRIRILWATILAVGAVVVFSTQGVAKPYGKCGDALEDFTPDPAFTSEFLLDNCTFDTVGDNPFFPLIPGTEVLLVGDGERVTITVSYDTVWVDGVETRVVVEFEEEYDDEAEEWVNTETSHNFFAHCDETGNVVYFGEVVVPDEGAWLAGDGALAGVIMPGFPFLGARYYQEIAPENEALDKGEIVQFMETCEVGEFLFDNCIKVIDTSDCDSSEKGVKIYAEGVGIVQDEDLVYAED